MKKLKIAVLFSGGCSAIPWLSQNDESYGENYQIVCGVADRPGVSGIELMKELGIPCEVIDFKRWRADNNVSPRDQMARSGYFDRIAQYVSPFQPDLILCSGFMRIITDPLLSEYRNRIINVHPADLSIVDMDGNRVYKGDNAVELAFDAGESETFSTIHFIIKEVDGGEIITISDPLSFVDGQSLEDHQEIMKSKCDGPAYKEALRMIYKEEITIGK